MRWFDGRDPAEAFVQRRIDNVMTFEKWKAGKDLDAPLRKANEWLGDAVQNLDTHSRCAVACVGRDQAARLRAAGALTKTPGRPGTGRKESGRSPAVSSRPRNRQPSSASACSRTSSARARRSGAMSPST